METSRVTQSNDLFQALTILDSENEPTRTGMHTCRRMGGDQAVIGTFDADFLVAAGLADYVRPGWVAITDAGRAEANR